MIPRTLAWFVRSARLGLWLAAALACLIARAPGAAAAPVPPLDHILVVVMENKSYDAARVASYTASLIASSSSFANSYGITHPSQPNYLAMWSGSTLAVTNDNCPAPGYPFYNENLGHACEIAGITWRAYSENLPATSSTVCSADGSLYTRKHDPWTYFFNLDHSNERPYAELQFDINAGTLPRLAYVIPNNCNNTHNTGCTVAVGDAWLAARLPGWISAVGSNGMVILTWDEDDFTPANHILTVFAGPKVLSGYVSTRMINHYSVLRTICDGLGIAPFAAAAVDSPITDVWDVVTAVQGAAGTARFESGRVRLSWEASDRTPASIERRTEAQGWAPLAGVAVGIDGRIAYEDAAVSPGARYGYRLAYRAGAQVRFEGEVWVDVPGATRLAIEWVRPNPASRELSVSCALGDAGPARIELLDLSGRAVLSRDALGPGRVVETLRPVTALAPGVYLLRLTQGPRSVVARATILR